MGIPTQGLNKVEKPLKSKDAVKVNKLGIETIARDSIEASQAQIIEENGKYLIKAEATNATTLKTIPFGANITIITETHGNIAPNVLTYFIIETPFS